MRLYQVQTPAGQPEPQARFEADLLATFGGYSASERSGAWRDPSDGMVYLEPMRVYEIAGPAVREPGKLSSLTQLASLAMLHYPEEKAVFVAEIGQAEIVQNGTPMRRLERAAPYLAAVRDLDPRDLEDGGIHRVV